MIYRLRLSVVRAATKVEDACVICVQRIRPEGSSRKAYCGFGSRWSNANNWEEEREKGNYKAELFLLLS